MSDARSSDVLRTDVRWSDVPRATNIDRGRRGASVAMMLLLSLLSSVPLAGDAVRPVSAGTLEPVPSQTNEREVAPPAERTNPTVPASPGIPAVPAPVVDEARILNAGQRRALEELAFDVKRTTGAEIAVLTVRTTAPLDEFTYGMKVVSAWKLGSAAKDDGLLLLVAVDDRRARFFPGYGLEGVLPDGRLGTILDRFVVPRFRGGDYAGGIADGIAEIARILKAEYGAGAKPVARSPAPGFLWTLLVWILLGSLVLRMLFGRRKRRFHPIFWGGGFGGPMSGGFGGGFGGRGRGGGFGGGFGGGGGGFGGGGAGRSW